MTNCNATLLAVCLTAVGCGDDGGGSRADGGAIVDAVVLIDASTGPDAGMLPHPGFGQISGACDVLDDELISNMSGFFQLAIDFERLYGDSDLGMLTAGGQKIIVDGTAGGSSVLSEAFAFEVLQRCEDAILLKTETEIEYDTKGKLTDFLAELDSEKIGVSVTRAVAFPFTDPYPLATAQELLSGKLEDILESSGNVGSADRWTKQILAVLAYGPEHAVVLRQAYDALDTAITADTLVVVIVTNGSDDFIYCNGLCQ